MAQHRQAEGEAGAAWAFCMTEALGLAARLAPPTAGLLDRLLDGSGAASERQR
jgi:hypothetical protein